MNQKEAVFKAVSELVPEQIPGKVQLDDNQLKHVHNQVVEMFMAGEVDYRGGLPSREKVVKYVPGLVNNWLRKDLRLNGGLPYEAKRPGSRTGSGDEQIQAMKTLLSQTTDPNDRELIQKAIDERKAALKPQPKELDVSKLPEHLRDIAAKVA